MSRFCYLLASLIFLVACGNVRTPEKNVAQPIQSTTALGKPHLAYSDFEWSGRTKLQSKVTITFPDQPDLSCDIWCYEGKEGKQVVQAESWNMDGEKLILHHLVADIPDLRVTTVFTPVAGGVEQQITIEGGTEAEIRSVQTPNSCVQFSKSAAFGPAPKDQKLDYVDDFVARCFIFTDKGLVLLKDTQRTSNEVPPDKWRAAESNGDRPWIQIYVPVWENWAKLGPGASEKDRPTYPIMGVISHDQKYLAAIACPDTNHLAQIWLYCMHPCPSLSKRYNPEIKKTVSRCLLYFLPNDGNGLLGCFKHDFPDWKEPDKQ